MRRAVVAGLLLLAGCAQQRVEVSLPAGSASQPDVILISLDTVRADHLGTYGYDRPTSPFLDEQARRGTVFEQAWAPSPWTLPTHASVLSALLPDAHGAIDEQHAIGPDVAMLPESLGVLGYRRAAFVTAPFVGARYGFDRGFDDFVDLSDTPEGFSLEETPDAADVTRAAIDWTVKQAAADPVFLFLHLYDAHYPYAPPSPFDARFDPPATAAELHYENYFHYFDHPLTDAQMQRQRNQYDEEIAYVDATLQLFCETWLRARPNTIFVVISDHGEEFGERGSWGHAHTLTPEQLHVPWIIWGAGIAARRIEHRVGLEDLAPTLAELAGTAFGPFDGTSRAGLVTAGSAETGAPGGLFASTSRRSTLRVRQHIAPFDLVVDLRSKAVAVYDLDADPQAMRDLRIDQDTPLRELWARAVESLGTPWEVREVVMVESDGVLVRANGQILAGRVALPVGARFGLFPLDATLRVVDDGATAGPWQQIGGALPGIDAPVILHGTRRTTKALELSDDEKERLRALGYAH